MISISSPRQIHQPRETAGSFLEGRSSRNPILLARVVARYCGTAWAAHDIFIFSDGIHGWRTCRCRARQVRNLRRPFVLQPQPNAAYLMLHDNYQDRCQLHTHVSPPARLRISTIQDPELRLPITLYRKEEKLFQIFMPATTADRKRKQKAVDLRHQARFPVDHNLRALIQALRVNSLSNMPRLILTL